MCVPFKEHFSLPKVHHLDWRCTVEGMDRPLKFVPWLLPHCTHVSAVPSPWIPSLIPQCPYVLSAVSLTPSIFHSCLDLTYEWLEMLLHSCVSGEEGWLMRPHGTNGRVADVSLTNSRNRVTHKALSKILKFAALQSLLGICVHPAAVSVQAQFAQKCLLHCSLRGDWKYPSSVVSDFGP